MNKLFDGSFVKRLKSMEKSISEGSLDGQRTPGIIWFGRVWGVIALILAFAAAWYIGGRQP